jgi:hypothetical protein
LAIAEPNGELRSLGTLANRAESIRKRVKKLDPVERLKACYEHCGVVQSDHAAD